MDERQFEDTRLDVSENKKKKEPKMISLFLAIMLALILAAGVFLSTFTVMQNKRNAEIAEVRAEQARFDKLSSLLDFVESEYVRGCDESEIMEKLYGTLFDSVEDPYSCYMTAEEYKEYNADRQESYVGIGVNVVFNKEENAMQIYRVTPDSPAEKAGLLKGDRIIKVENVEIGLDTYEKAVDMVKGVEGTPVNLTVVRGEETKNYRIVRGTCPAVEVVYEKIGNIAYIQIYSFKSAATTKQFVESLAKAKEDGCDSYLFDVRNNPGGDLGVICDVLDMLIKKADLVHMVAADGTDTVRSTKTDAHLDAPMAVLTNGSTASAAELFTADLRENKNAYLIGTKTFGKGTMQTVRYLNDGSAFKLTNRFYNPTSNVSYDKVGIMPDLEVTLTADEESRFYLLEHDEDPQLQAAIKYLTK